MFWYNSRTLFSWLIVLNKMFVLTLLLLWGCCHWRNDFVQRRGPFVLFRLFEELCLIANIRLWQFGNRCQDEKARNGTQVHAQRRMHVGVWCDEFGKGARQVQRAPNFKLWLHKPEWRIYGTFDEWMNWRVVLTWINLTAEAVLVQNVATKPNCQRRKWYSAVPSELANLNLVESAGRNPTFRCGAKRSKRNMRRRGVSR